MINIRHLLFVVPLVFMAASLIGTATRETPLSAQGTETGSIEIRGKNRSYGISAGSVLRQQRNKQKLFLVDIRNRESYNSIRIPGAINLSMDAIKAKVFLKSRPVVLIHEGWGYRRMSHECKHLEGLGFDIRILSGGLNAWQTQGGALEGDPFLRKNLNKMTPQAFYLEKDSDKWMIIHAGAVQDAASGTLMPSAIHIPILEDSKEGFKKLRHAAGKKKNHPFRSILIFNKIGTDYDRMELMIPKDILYTIFFLSGGFDGYQRFLQHLSLSRRSKESRVKTVGKCKPCIEKKGQQHDR